MRYLIINSFFLLIIYSCNTVQVAREAGKALKSIDSPFQAKKDDIPYEKAQFPWAASGRALSLGKEQGFTKLLFDKKNGRILGGGIIGSNAGDLIAEVGLAIEMGADAADISLTIHPHPTLSETIAFSAEAYEGTLTDLYIPKKKIVI